MPYVKKNRTKSKRKFNKRRKIRKKVARARSGFTLTNYSTGSPLPPRYKTKLIYGFSGGSSSAVPDNNKIRLNSLYDPELTAGGHQPLGFDQMALLYGRYLVTKVEAKFHYVLNTSSSLSCMISILANNDSTDLDPSTMAVMEKPYCKNLFIDLDKRSASHRAVYYPHRITGVPYKTYISDDRYQSLVSTNPTEDICLHQVISNVLGSATTLNPEVVINCTLVYHCEFFDPKVLAQS